MSRPVSPSLLLEEGHWSRVVMKDDDDEPMSDVDAAAPRPYTPPGLDAQEQGQLSLMQKLDVIANAPTDCELGQSRRELQVRRLMCATAAENRRWQDMHQIDVKRGRESPGPGAPTLRELAEEALGAGFRKVCEELLPSTDFCALSWTPSACDDNMEPCRIKRHRPAVEAWSHE